MNKLNIKISQYKFVSAYFKDMKIKDIKYLWIDFIQVRNCFMN